MEVESFHKQNIYIGFWKRVLIYLIDIIILAIPSVYLYRYSYFVAIDLQSGIPLIARWVLLFIYFISFTVIFGGTPGKLILKTRVVNKEGHNLSIFSATIRYSFLILNGFVLALIEVEKFHNSDNNFLSLISSFTGLLLLIDATCILFNKQKRALHDVLARSLVIKKN